jgi:CubicO group peptidase (beta-lactamase class C family)
MKQFFSAAFLVFLSIAGSAQKKDNRLAGLDTMIQRILKEWNVPGASIAVVEKNRVLLTKGFGTRDVATNKPVTENTQFAIGSCTKAFTASLVGTAMQDGLLELDEPVTNYIGTLKFYSPELNSSVTVRDMLCHRTGLPRHDYSWYSGNAGSRDSLLYLLRYLEPSAPLRQSFQYNNYMYAALGSLVEKLSGKTWEKLVEERFFSTLGMTRSTTGAFNKEGDFSYGYTFRDNKVQQLNFLPEYLQGIAPAGALVSTAKDMANWLLLWTNQGKLNGKEVIPFSFYQQAISSQMIASANLPGKQVPDYYFFNYGLGWYTASYRGHYGVGHGGNINGFSSFVTFLPTDSIGVFVSVNQNNSAAVRVLSNLILDRMIRANYLDWNSLIKMSSGAGAVAPTMPSKQGNPSHPMSAYAGVYKHDGYGTIIIKEENNALTGSFNRWKLNIKHKHYNYYTITIQDNAFDGSEAMDAVFSIDAAGNISSVQVPFQDGVSAIEFIKQRPVVAANTADMKSYEGNFDFNGSVVKIYLHENGTLRAQVPGQPEYEMIWQDRDLFTLKGIKGVSIQFDRDASGAVPSGSFIQPNGSFKVNRIATGKGAEKITDKVQGGIQKYVGEYLLSGQVVKVFTKEDQLIAQLPGQPAYTLVPGNKDEFSIKGVRGFSVQFESNDKEEVTALILQQPNGKVRAARKD